MCIYIYIYIYGRPPPKIYLFDQKSSENTENMKPSFLRHFLLSFSKLGGPISKHITNTCIFRSHLAMVLSAWWNNKTFGKILKTKENQKEIRENQKNKVVKGFRRTLGYGCGLVWLFGFPECLFPKNLRENQKTNKTKPISKGGSETSKHFVVLVLPNVSLVFFGLLCYCWLSDQSNEQHFYLNRFVKSAAPQLAQASSFSISP